MQRLRVNAPAVVHQTIDAGMDRESVLALVSRRWSGAPDRMRDGVLGLIAARTFPRYLQYAWDLGTLGGLPRGVLRRRLKRLRGTGVGTA